MRSTSTPSSRPRATTSTTRRTTCTSTSTSASRATTPRPRPKEDLDDPRHLDLDRSDQRFCNSCGKPTRPASRSSSTASSTTSATLHPAFRDVQENGPKSKYADWFQRHELGPIQVRGLVRSGALPVFKKTKDGFASERLKQHIFNVTRRWMDPDGDGDPRDGIDGWRLDVPNEVPAPSGRNGGSSSSRSTRKRTSPARSGTAASSGSTAGTSTR